MAKTLAEDHPSRLASQQWLEYILEAADRDELDYNVSGSH
jgi:hypothetical protein